MSTHPAEQLLGATCLRGTKPIIGTLIIRIGFGAQCAIITVRNPQNSIGNLLGPYIIPQGYAP